MATSPDTPANSLMAFFQSALGRQLALGAGMAMVLGIMAAVWMWNAKPDYRVLLSNYSDRDGGAIVAALQQMNIPYQYAEGGGAILVPAERVHDARLKLATQGLPKGGNVGFELMENQKLGVSQFLEQVNFQRAMEGELARTINSIASVQSARVHLAIPKPSVFVRDKERPTASVLLNLHAGRQLDRQQVSAILHLVASSVPDLTTKNVTVVDQNGALLSNPDTQAGNNQLDPQQLKYIAEVQDSIVKRIESILTPMVGKGNVRAEASAEVDFSRTEQAAETYKPNGTPDDAAMRSQRINETTTPDAAKVGGVPGAASNQPAQKGATAPAVEASEPTSTQRDNTINYEVDKTVRYVQQSMGGIKRLTVAVLVNHKREVAADGKVSLRALTADEKAQVTDLVKEAMGFNKERGDSLSVANSAFTEPPKEIIPEEPIWQPYANLGTVKIAGQYALTTLLMLYLFFGVLRPLIKKATDPGRAAVMPIANASNPPAPTANNVSASPNSTAPEPGYDSDLLTAKQLAIQEPKVVANVVKTWVNGHE
jgi:flagellar M-ring protein FliF